MIRTLLCTTALMMAAPAALAQDTSTAPTPPAEMPAMEQPAMDSSAAAQPATQPAASDQITAIVEAEFPTYDADKSGQLEQAEFGAWIAALKAQEAKATGKVMADAEVQTYAAGAFVAADADKSAAVTKAELVTFLAG